VGSIFLVSAPSFSLFAWAHRLSTLAWPSTVARHRRVELLWQFVGGWRIGQGGLVLPKKFGLAVPDRTKQARSTLQLWELKESGGVRSERE